MNLFSLEGKIAFVTGAGSGIGQRIALGFAEAGASVGCFDLARSSSGLNETVKKIEEAGQRGLVLTGDVTKPESLSTAISTLEKELGPLSVAANCAGVADAAPPKRCHWPNGSESSILIRPASFFPVRQKQRSCCREEGSIVNIASMSGTIVNRGILQVHYNASKAAVIHLTKSFAMEWCPSGIRVNAISPGYTATPMNVRPEVAEQVKQFEADTPMGRMASVDEMVGPAVFLSSKAASFVTGIDLIVDGGFVCW